MNRGLRRFFWKPLQQQLQTDVSSSSDIVSPWLPTWPDSIEPFAVITSPSRRTAPCAACVITIFFFLSYPESLEPRTRTRSFRESSSGPGPRISIVSLSVRSKGGWNARGLFHAFLVLILARWRGSGYAGGWVPTLCGPASRVAFQCYVASFSYRTEPNRFHRSLFFSPFFIHRVSIVKIKIRFLVFHR